MVKYREILRLRALGISIRGIAHSCGCSPTTVETVLHRATAKGVEWPLPAELDDRALHGVLYPKGERRSSEKAPIDHGLVDREMSRPGVTLTLTAAPSLKTVRTLAAGIAAGGPADAGAGAYLRGGGYCSDFEERA